MAAGFAFVEHEISAPLKIILAREYLPSSFPVFEPLLLRACGERESCKQIATLNPRCRSAERPGSLCLRGSLKCVESGEGEHPDRGRPGPRPAPGKRHRREQPAPSQDPRLRRPRLFPCAFCCFSRLTRREGRGGKDPCGCPLPITNIVVSCRWLPHFLIQLTRRLPTLWKYVASELRRPRSPRVSQFTTTSGGGSGCGSPPNIVPKVLSSPSLCPRRSTPRRVKAGAGLAGKGAVVCWFLNIGLHRGVYADPPFPGWCEYCLC